MGYYIHTQGSNFRIKQENFANAYRAMCELNKYDDLKTGGSSTGEKWFSWMSADYPNECKDIFEVFDHLGFEVVVSEKPEGAGDIIWVDYNNKHGDEEVFFAAIAPFVEEGSHIDWVGEDYDMWRWLFTEGKMLTIEGQVIYDLRDAKEPVHRQFFFADGELQSNATPLNDFVAKNIKVRVA